MFEIDHLNKLASDVLRHQPFAQHLGMTLSHIESGRSVLKIPLNESMMQHHKVAHGGAIASLADSAVAFAAGSLSGDALTLELKVNYMHAARGETLTAVAEVTSQDSDIAVCSCRVYSENDNVSKLVAIAQGTVKLKSTGDKPEKPGE